MLFSIIFLIIGFFLLIRGANAFVEGAGALAQKMRVPEIIIGLTVVAIGTSAPEAAISIVSAVHESGGVAIGNVLGSNIANILLIMGVAAIVHSFTIQSNTIKYEIPFAVLITLSLMILGGYYGVISRPIALFLCGLLVLFVCYAIRVSRQQKQSQIDIIPMHSGKIALYIIGGLSVLIIGSELTVNSAIEIARALNVSERIIGLTIIAIGTSLPEFATVISAAIKKRPDLAVGGIVGSNIFNILFVLGVAGIIHPIPFQYAFIFDCAVALLAVAMLWVFALYRTKLMRHHGIIFLGLYVLYILYLVLYS